jgi:hypothetical protein
LNHKSCFIIYAIYSWSFTEHFHHEHNAEDEQWKYQKCLKLWLASHSFYKVLSIINIINAISIAFNLKMILLFRIKLYFLGSISVTNIGFFHLRNQCSQIMEGRWFCSCFKWYNTSSIPSPTKLNTRFTTFTV